MVWAVACTLSARWAWTSPEKLRISNALNKAMASRTPIPKPRRRPLRSDRPLSRSTQPGEESGVEAGFSVNSVFDFEVDASGIWFTFE
jgi:hypothetical protein